MSKMHIQAKNTVIDSNKTVHVVNQQHYQLKAYLSFVKSACVASCAPGKAGIWSKDALCLSLFSDALCKVFTRISGNRFTKAFSVLHNARFCELKDRIYAVPSF